jgi:hypothetical protein
VRERPTVVMNLEIEGKAGTLRRRLKGLKMGEWYPTFNLGR